jgi:biotin carboxyl carrier protein
MIYTVKINDKEYEVEVERGKANIIKTTEGATNDKPAPAPVITSSPVQSQSAASASGEIIKSPMPGTILDIKVNQGSRVKKGDILLILEAMKMENEILAPHDGIIAQVFTSKGSSVSTNDLLISIN